MSGLAYLGIAEAAELIRSKKLSPLEYAKALLARIERFDSRYNAFIMMTAELALNAARDAEAEIARGHWRGPFHGIPFALKDIIDVAGLPTTGHSKISRRPYGDRRCAGGVEAEGGGRRASRQARDP